MTEKIAENNQNSNENLVQKSEAVSNDENSLKEPLPPEETETETETQTDLEENSSLDTEEIDEELNGEKPVVLVKDLRKVYRLGSEKVVALNKINLKIMNGEIVCIIGTSGSGKSTLLNQLAGLEKPTKGSVYIYGKNVSKMSENTLAKLRQKYIGFVFQSYNLLPMMTAIENVAMPLMFKGISKSVREKQAKKMLKAVGLGSRYKHKPTQMSGGQQQRVGIARAFASNSKIVFADEPTGNLDTKTTMEVMELMVSLSKKNNRTLIIVTHDKELSLFADRIITLIDGNIISDVYNENVVTTAEEAMEIMKKELSEAAGEEATEQVYENN